MDNKRMKPQKVAEVYRQSVSKFSQLTLQIVLRSKVALFSCSRIHDEYLDNSAFNVEWKKTVDMKYSPFLQVQLQFVFFPS